MTLFKIFISAFISIIISVLILYTCSTGADVVVPSSLNLEEQESWTPTVDSMLAAGDTVRFINNRGRPVNVPYIGLTGGTDGLLVYKTTLGSWDSVTLISGGFHQFYVNKISPRSAGLGIRVKFIIK